MGTVPAKSMITSHRSKTKNNNSSNLFSKWALFPIFWHRIHQTMNPFIKNVITNECNIKNNYYLHPFNEFAVLCVCVCLQGCWLYILWDGCRSAAVPRLHRGGRAPPHLQVTWWVTPARPVHHSSVDASRHVIMYLITLTRQNTV